MHALGYAAICLIFGTTFIAIKTGLGAGGAPLQLAGLRFLLAGALVVGFFAVFRRQGLGGLRLREVAAVSLFTTVVPFGALFLGSVHITAGEAALLVASSVAFLSLMSPSDRLQKVGVAVALGGMAVLFWPDLLRPAGSGASWAAKLSILAAEALYAFGTVRIGRVLASGASPYLLNGWQMLVGGLCLLALSLAVEGPALPPVSAAYWLSLLHLAVVGSILGAGLYYGLIRAQGPFLPSTSMFVSAGVAAVAGSWWLGEAVTAAAIAGAVLIAGSMGFVHWKAVSSWVAAGMAALRPKRLTPRVGGG